MSLFGSIHTAANALFASQIGLQVVGNNLANVNTPGYIREDVIFTPSPPHRQGNLILGLGVQVDGVVQQIDRLLAERLRSAESDLANGETQQSTYTQLEAILGELGDTDLSTSLTKFFGSLNDVLNQPEDLAVRNVAILQGSVLTDHIRRLAGQVLNVREEVNNRLANSAADIDRLLSRVAELNVQIVTVEGGRSSASDAVGLRDERQRALHDLASLIDVRAIEQPSGSISVFAGGDFLVVDGTHRGVKAAEVLNDAGRTDVEIRVTATDSPLPGVSGKLAGLVTSRDEIIDGFLDQLNSFTETLIFEFNKIHAGGQGLTGLTEATSEFAVENSSVAIDQAGLEFTPVNGSFQIRVGSEETGLVQTTTVPVRLNGLDDDTTLNDIVSALDGIDGISAAISPSGQLSITSDGPPVEFTFGKDTSGVLAALGLNTFFSGSSIADVSVSESLSADPSKLVTSLNAVQADTDVISQLASLLDQPLDAEDGATIASLYDGLVASVTQGAAVTRSVAEGFRAFQQTLESEHLSISGVNLDEEAVKMLAFQRSFQASARLISTISELMEVLVNL